MTDYSFEEAMFCLESQSPKRYKGTKLAYQLWIMLQSTCQTGSFVGTSSSDQKRKKSQQAPILVHGQFKWMHG
ncbi:unnamed protein product [Tetraodon nigroviridis]|uniref:Chromosome 15 SCAF14542, whole genome shotgun sequence n=1 Tax=Tetraodon nigroviridis TaxID=99883 RepID=Q4SNK6_TETNG|nr:unnamed protein product [Tetraodon nigroviridis]